ncbi:hypothetical protein KKB10_05530 [Patescibacteria group bacterium]|nr:hypothetical protein [Patescibacteria group bacterium]MBU1075346.1 hypothetical protein [Patescibacteria group bacterium]MBU1951721.1 hypothetical protein [Patescibacteria group bacterium]
MEKRKLKYEMLENIDAEEHDPFMDRHFSNNLKQLKKLDEWLKKHKMAGTWTLDEKLSFLRNVEANIRTGASFRRTQLSWLALLIALLAALSGFFIGTLIK